MNEVLEVKNKTYSVSSELEEMSKDVMSDKNMDISPAKVKYVLVHPMINKKTAGRCVKTNNLTKLFGDCDYVIEMSGELWEGLDRKTQSILMWHELMHISVTFDKEGEPVYKLRQHDVQDFYMIIKSEGIEWLDNLKTIHASVYDIDSIELSEFNI